MNRPLMTRLLKITITKFKRSLGVGIYVLGLASLLCSVNASAAGFWSLDWFEKDAPIEVTVNDAFINVHNAPGRGYPAVEGRHVGELLSTVGVTGKRIGLSI